MARGGSLKTPNFRQRKNIDEDFSNGNSKHRVKNVHGVKNVRRVEKLKFFKSKCCFLPRFSNKIKSWEIDSRGWELLRRTPFGRIIEAIPKLDMNVEILDALLNFWDDNGCGFVIAGNTIPFTADDIALITGLPNRGDKVLRMSTDYSSKDRTLVSLEKSLDQAVQIYKSSPNSENDRFFVQQMILYLWGSVWFTTCSRVVPAYLVYYVQNLEAIGNYNWAEAIHSLLVKDIKSLKNIESKKVGEKYIHGLCLAVNVWFFEHVDFGEDSKPSDPSVRPRLLKWVKVCKDWPRRRFLRRFRYIMKDEVSYHILRENVDLELVSLDIECHMRSQIVGGSDDALKGSDDALRGETSSQVNNLENIESDIQGGCERTNERDRLAEEGNNRQIDNSEIKHLTENLNKQNERVSLLERNYVKLERLLVSKGWKIEEEIDDTDDLTGHKVGKGDEEVHDIKVDGMSCIEVHKVDTMEGIGQANQGCRQSGNRKKSASTKKSRSGNRKPKSTITLSQLSVKRKRDVNEEQACIPTMKSSTRSGWKDVDILVNVDDYASPIKQKKEAKVAPLKYVGRELLTKKEREYLDAFCIKPMPTDEIVFFYWNIAIRRHSMVEYLQGGYTAEEIIDAYARILYESDEVSENSVASFLYVPPMFLGLYRNKLGSYRTFLNSVDMKSLEKVKFLFLPFLVSTANHWLLLVCDMEKRKWAVYDSLFDPRHREPAKEQITLLAEYLHQDHEFDIRSWGLEYRKISPQQEAGSLDCGVFVMKFIENIIRVPRTINFRGTDAQLFRPQIAYKILCHC